MFSSGQLAFAVFFLIAFIIVMIYSYRKDIVLHKKHFKGSLWVLVGFLVFVGILVLAKHYLKS